MNSTRINVDRALHGLKDFQRKTVQHVFRRMYLDPNPAERFLIADEVGLGKTLVARGIIALAVEHLQKTTTDRIDIVYICSNATIAQQNLNKLNATDEPANSFATRMTLLPAKLKDFRKKSLNFISFTPGTTFDLKKRGGLIEERVLIFRMLRDHLSDKLDRTPLLNLLQANASVDRWRNAVEYDEAEYDAELAKTYCQSLWKDKTFFQELSNAYELFARQKQIKGDLRETQLNIIGQLRERLAQVSINQLEPDLVILDEFQRFKSLLNSDDDTAKLANQLFNYATEKSKVRVLLLSATPYRLLSMDHEQEEDHYTDFVDTLRFLMHNDESRIEQIRQDLRQLRLHLCGISHDNVKEIDAVRHRLEQSLRSVIARTERIDISRSPNAMTSEVSHPISLTPADLQAARMIDQVSRAVGGDDVIEYWKSSPYLLNFMDKYALKQKLIELRTEPPPALLQALKDGKTHLLRRGDIRAYTKLAPSNPRLRCLLANTVAAGQWQWLWLPPSMPYWTPSGAYADTSIPATKSLIFSAWQVVPDAIAAISSYEAERRVLEVGKSRHREDRLQYDTLHKKRRSLLQLRNDPTDGRPSNMPALMLLYPSATLASIVDPLKLALEIGEGEVADLSRVRETAKRTLDRKIQAILPKKKAAGSVDQRWYWVAPLLLDDSFATEIEEWIRSTDESGWFESLRGHHSNDSDSDRDGTVALRRHHEAVIELLDQKIELGRPPDDLIDVLVDLALGSPAVLAVRSLQRVAHDLPETSHAMLAAATKIANAMQTQFNHPEAIELIRGNDESMPYWRRVLAYSIEGNLQSVLDEYVHVLKDNVGLAHRGGEEIVQGLAESMVDAMSLRQSSIKVDQVTPTKNGQIQVKDFSMRCRFAQRYGDVRDADGERVVRADNVRKAFNSPFRPFILASTSVGQEGLDFHQYSHVVVHWNLPSNPVDLEQREGRVHRFKGHAIRRNLAKAYGLNALIDSKAADPWDELFALAVKDRPKGATDLTPYWLFETVEGHQVERRLMTLPLSRETAKYQRLKKMLAVYRLAFGQPRQEDLIAHLAESDRGKTIERLNLRP